MVDKSEEKTTVAINTRTLDKLDKLKVHERQPYSEIIEKIVDESLKKRGDKI